MSSSFSQITIEQLNAGGRDFLPGHLGVNITEIGDGFLEAELEVRQTLMAPNGYLHAGSVVAFADTACGYACTRALPEGAAGFTTIELKSNFLSTATEGFIICRAEAHHLGRATQLWDAAVKRRSDGRTIALFRCTQMVLWPR